MSKILILTNHSYMFYRFRKELLAELLKSYEVVLGTPFVGHENDLAAMGARCIETPLNRRGTNPFEDRKLYRQYRQLLKQEKPDLVVTYSVKPNVYGGEACKKAGIPYCANVQGIGTAFQKPMTAFLVTRMYRKAFRGVHTVFFENESNAEEFARRRIVKEDKQCVLSGAGVNLETYKTNGALQCDDGKIHFLYLGRIMHEKGMDELLGAVRRLWETDIPFVLDIVGFFEDKYEKDIKELEKKGLVHFYGFTENPVPYYEKCDCVILPSYHEGMSNVLLEAAAMSRPIIASDIPGCREAVEDGVSGILCNAKDTESLYQAMLRFAQMDDEERELMGRCGRYRMEQKFDKNGVVRDTVQKLKEAMK